MPLEYILRRFAQKTGIACYATATREADPEQTLAALDIINEAAEELWESVDIPSALQECVLLMPPSKQLALPSFIGQLRAIREYHSHEPWRLSTVRPRYLQNSWSKQEFRNWRDKGYSPIYRTFLNVSPVKFIVPAVETPPIEIVITGSTDVSNRTSAVVTINATTVESPVQLNEIFSIRKNRLSDYNIVVTDADGEELAVIYNNEIESRYRVVDCAEFTCSFTDSRGNIPVEVLFKPVLTRMENSHDEFPAKGYDHVILNKALQLYYENENNLEAAVAHDRKAERTILRKIHDSNAGKEFEIKPQEHPHGNIFRRMRV